MTWRRFTLGLVGLLLGTFLVAIGGEAWFRVDARLTTLGEWGLLFLAAAAGRPTWLYPIIRNGGWFAGIQNDRVMKGLLIVFGLAALWLALVAGPPRAAAG